MPLEIIEPTPISGFPEWLPEDKYAELQIISNIRHCYELYGFVPIETPAVERLEVLTAKGGIQKQIFTLGRPEEDRKSDREQGLGLHFDLTVPLARYVAQWQHELDFPFRRYQIQKVWRGEKAQRGRFREFYQCDVDIIGRNSLDVLFDAEIASVIENTLLSLGLRNFEIRLSNVKILLSLLDAHNVAKKKAATVMRLIDKARSRGLEAIKPDLLGVLGTKSSTSLLDLLGSANDLENAERVLAKQGASIDGVGELKQVIDAAMDLGTSPGALVPDLTICRGLDYYTGTVYETFVQEKEEWGSVCSGGRYDDLAQYFTRERFPGVGVSIGLTRLFELLRDSDQLSSLAKVPTKVLVTMQDRARFKAEYLKLASDLRAKEIATEVVLDEASLGAQLGYASSKGIPIAVIAGEEEFGRGSVSLKDLRTGNQVEVTITELTSSIMEMLEVST